MLFDATLNTGKQILRKYARKYDFGHNIESADAFVNYLEKTGYEALVEAGQLISEKVNCIMDFFLFLHQQSNFFFLVIYRRTCGLLIYGN